MPELRPSVLLRRRRTALTVASLVGAEALFLWMFLAADPLEQLAAAGAFGSDADAIERAFAFAAAWRHGMSGNSPLYMPGFFAVAVAAWIWSEQLRARDAVGYAAAFAAAFFIARLAAPSGAAVVHAAYQAVTGSGTALALPFPRSGAVIAGTYTLITWSAFVIGCRLAIERRSFLPILPTPVLTAGLILLRPWTVDDFTTTWWERSLEGDPVAIASALMIPAVAAGLAGRELNQIRFTPSATWPGWR